MMLEDLIKNTWDIHPDLSGLELACEEVLIVLFSLISLCHLPECLFH